MWESHTNLRGGEGEIITSTHSLRFFKKDISFIKLYFEPSASIGWHQHKQSSEIYITFNKNIRFNEQEKWKMFNVCKIKNKHCAKNLSPKREASIYAIKVSKR